jgi:hypothetical protein
MNEQSIQQYTDTNHNDFQMTFQYPKQIYRHNSVPFIFPTSTKEFKRVLSREANPVTIIIFIPGQLIHIPDWNAVKHNRIIFVNTSVLPDISGYYSSGRHNMTDGPFVFLSYRSQMIRKMRIGPKQKFSIESLKKFWNYEDTSFRGKDYSYNK